MSTRVVARPAAKINTWRRDGLLIALTAAAGAVDAISYLGLGHIFTANMTGNIVLLGLGVGQEVGSDILRSGVAFAGFAVGALLAGAALRQDSAAPWRPDVTAALVGVLATQGGFLLGWELTGTRPAGGVQAILIAVLAVGMGLQSGAVRSLPVSGVSTTYITGTLTGLLAELANRRKKPDTARRVGVLVGLLAGAAVGGVLLSEAPAWAPVVPVLLVTAVIAVAVTGLGGAEEEQR